MIDIYRPENTEYEKNGDMTLFPESATVHVMINGMWDAEIIHPIDDDGRWKYIKEDAVIRMPSFNGMQLFRIYQKTKEDDYVTAKAYPIFLDAKDDCFLVDVRPYEKNGQEALDILLAENTKYSGRSNITKLSTAYYEYKNLIEALNGDISNAFVKRWGGEILYNNFEVVINDRLGADNGVQVLYGKNIPEDGIIEDVNTDVVTTRIYPKAFNGYKLSTGYVDSELINRYPKIKAKTITFENVKMAEDAYEDEEDDVIICANQEELDEALIQMCMQQYSEGIDKPEVTLSINMAFVEDPDYYSFVEDVSLGDTIHCRHRRLDIVTDARVIELVYDSVDKKVTSVVIGDYVSSFFDGVASAVNRIESAIRQDGTVVGDRIQGFIDGANAQLRTMVNASHRQEAIAILFENLDEDNPLYGALAIGTQGLIISKQRTSDGRSWDWTSAMTANGLTANVIVSGIIADRTGSNYINLDTGEFALSSTGFTLNGQPVDEILETVYDTQRIENIATSAAGASIQSLSEQFAERYAALQTALDNYKADLGQYMRFNPEEGLSLGALTSAFRTVVDNRGMYFKEMDTIVAYIKNNQLRIPSAVIESVLQLGQFVFNPLGDGGIAIVWED